MCYHFRSDGVKSVSFFCTTSKNFILVGIFLPAEKKISILVGKLKLGGVLHDPKRTDNAAERNSKGTQPAGICSGYKKQGIGQCYLHGLCRSDEVAWAKPKVKPEGIWAIFKEASEG